MQPKPAPNHWLEALRQETGPSVLVTVVQTQGSAPRDAGARMLVSAQQQFDTIGGGHLEWQATQLARSMLAQNCADGEVILQRFTLGASLGQCCGGVVWLLLEVVRGATHRWLNPPTSNQWPLVSRLVAETATNRACAQAAVQGRLQQLGPDELQGLWMDKTAPTLPTAHQATAPELASGQAASGHVRWLVQQQVLLEYPLRTAATLAIFGAGHVSRALLPLLLPLGWQLIVVDRRAEVLESLAPSTPNVGLRLTEHEPEELDTLPEGALLLIMTHSHALDFELTQAALQRQDWRYLGLIGSRTKYHSFCSRLQQRQRPALPNQPTASLAPIICPIGIAQIPGKTPYEVALAIAAELLQVVGGVPSQQLAGKWKFDS